MFNVLLGLASFAATLTEAKGHTGSHADTPVHEMLKAAINRGVPMYNKGWHQSCAMVYETALHALVLGEWGVSDEDREMLEAGLAEGMEMTKNMGKAWHYRHLMDHMLKNHHEMEESEMEETPAEAPKMKKKKMLFDFESESDMDSWDIVLDGVMGGKSTGFVEQTGDKMLFYGTTSLENNGGFSSIRADLPPGALTGMTSLRMRVKGDGRTYILGTSGLGSYSYWTRFETMKGEWMTVDFPIKDMEATWFGMPRSGRINPEDVRGLELYVYDKQAGPFKLKVDSIKAMM